MSVVVPLDQLSDSEKKEIIQDLTVSSKAGFGPYAKNVEIYLYAPEDDDVFIPFYYATQKYKQFPNDGFTETSIEFEGKLREHQKDVVEKAMNRLRKTRCVFLSMATGKGKTLTSIYLSCQLKLKVCVLLYRVNLFSQWEESIQKVIPNAKIQILNTKDKIDPSADFYLINPSTVIKRPRSDFSDIGLLIADEAHALCSESLSKSLLHFTPKYCIGLSATPERSDNLHTILDFHFGKSTDHIHVPLYVEHNYYKFDTNLTPEVKKNRMAETDWNSVLEFQATHSERNLWIANVCKFFKERNILILCKRVSHVQKLCEILKNDGESVDYTTGTKKKFDTDARILVSTYSKSGVGFDHPKLDMMIVASDVEEMFEQYFGRCVRREDVIPIFVDFVDNNNTLERHFKTRKNYSKKVGGTLKNFKASFPEFFEESKTT